MRACQHILTTKEWANVCHMMIFAIWQYAVGCCLIQQCERQKLISTLDWPVWIQHMALFLPKINYFVSNQVSPYGIALALYTNDTHTRTSCNGLVYLDNKSSSYWNLATTTFPQIRVGGKVKEFSVKPLEDKEGRNCGLILLWFFLKKGSLAHHVS
jgi:hypothetical protein